ncbi:bifunctional folylpolyglutamate synthase/dihydrofolate synthase [Enterobacter asburiae]|uniref:Bifunctional folylpolyglutamate synthase/dihydrofolate synthase n=1 Tax=Enterobacter asburiae TaxID=61645 RepID=A0A376FLI1_ENTAS|nr:bifunctional folylpolyglutamate synthase/dihydrofolate synthase [Enterobacter asburiae]
MLHDKDIGGTLACMESVVDSWYCAPLEGPRGATAEQLMEHLGKGAIYSSVAQAWHAAMADAKPEDTVLVCGSFHTGGTCHGSDGRGENRWRVSFRTV